MAKETFNSIWGDLQVGSVTSNEDKNKGGKNPEDKPEDKVDDIPDEEEEEEGDEGVSTEDKSKDDKGSSTNTDDDGEEYDFTDDDISKAYTMLEEEGILELGEDDEFEMSPSGLADAVGATVQNKLKKEIEAIPTVVQEFYAHVKQGNPIDSFVASKAEVIWEDFNLETEENQELTLRQLYKTQGMAEDDIEEEIADIKEAGKLEKKALAGKSVLAVAQNKELDARKLAKKNADVKAKEGVTKEIERIKGVIDNLDEMAGFKLDTERKKQFKDYLFKLDPRTTTTQMQKNMADEERKLRIAFLDFIDYTKADLTKEESTKLTRTRKKKLSKFTDKGVKNRNASATVKTGGDSKKGKLIIPSIFGTQNIEIED